MISMLLQFRMLSDEDDNFVRDYIIPYNFTLLDFHNFICNDLDYDPDNMCSFFASDAQWQKLQEFTLMDMGMEESEGAEDDGAPIAMVNCKLSHVIRKNNDRLIYQFDMLNDRSLYIELMEAQKSDNPQASVMLSHGTAPDQYDGDSSVENRSIFDEAMSDFDDYESDESYSEDE